MPDRQTRPAPSRKQQNLLFDPTQYTAFPQVVRLEGDELLMAFRQAPRQDVVRHTHMRSVITVIRSYDLGATWDIDNATQLAAGGGQECGLICLGSGHVGAAVAWHEVFPRNELARAGISHSHPHEYPFSSRGAYWAMSDNFGLTWPPEKLHLIGEHCMPCAPPVLLAGGDLLMPVYGMDEGAGARSSVLFRSTDRGATWTGPVTIARGGPAVGEFCEPAIIEHAPGKLLALHRLEQPAQGERGYFWFNHSADDGATWTKPKLTPILSGACPRLLKLRDGRLLLTYGRRFEPCGIRAAISADGGESWGDTEYILRDGPNGDLGYTSSIELDDGRILTATYMQRRGVTGIVTTIWKVPT